MTESAEEPLLEQEEPGAIKKKAKRSVKPRSAAGTRKVAATKAAKPRRARKTKTDESDTVAGRAEEARRVDDGAHAAAPAADAPSTPRVERTEQGDPVIEEWRPSGGKKREEARGSKEAVDHQVTRGNHIG